MNTIKQLEQRVADLEAMPVPGNATLERASQTLLQRAARFGLSEAEVVSRFGGLPGFAYACMTTSEFTTPEEQLASDEQCAAAVAKHGSAREAYMAMLRVRG
jgi:hypothetical protein